jgi:hypothetical protein
MSNNTVLGVVVWLLLAIHLVVGVIVWRQKGSVTLLPVVNLAVAASVLAYWGQRWFGYLFRGITWYASDQLIPAYALVVAVVSILALSGRYSGTLFHWVVFGVDTLVVVAAVLFVTFFRMNRLI